MFEKKILAAAVIGTFVLPGAVFAADPPAKPAVPTLDQVLEASGVSLGGSAANTAPGTTNVPTTAAASIFFPNMAIFLWG